MKERRGDLHEALRCATHSAHVRLNHHPLLVGLTRPGYPLETYRLVLRVYAWAYGELEARILAWLERHPSDFDYRARRKHGWLLQDLAWFGDVPATPAAEAVACPEVDSPGALLGMLYPLEGATLGGQVIAPQLDLNLGLQAATGGRFFAAYGDENPEKWRQFLAFLGRQQPDPVALDQTLKTACQTFLYLEGLLDWGLRTGGGGVKCGNSQEKV